MTNTTTTTKITVTVQMAEDLRVAAIGPMWGSNGRLHEYEAAVEAGDWDTADAIRAEQEALEQRAAADWIAAAKRIGAEWGYDVTAYAADAGSWEAQQQTRTPADADDEFGSTVEEQLWQAAHDAITVEA